MKTLLEKIEEQIKTLDPRDGDAHIWWGKFREFVKEHEFELWLNKNYSKATYEGLWLNKTFPKKVYRIEDLRRLNNMQE